MTSQQNIFVFIDEDQQKKYSKSTLSAINAQVAKYAHKNRPFTPKARPTQRHSPTASTEDEEPTKQTNHHKLSGRNPPVASRPGSQAQIRASDPPDGKKSVKKRHRTSARLPHHAIGENDPCRPNTASAAIAHAKPEDLNGLFSRLCRITKLPTYQEFPFFLDIEERRLTHYWFTEVIQEDFGMSKAQFENSFQSCLVKYPLSYQVPLRWMIAHSAKRLYDKTGAHSLAVVYRNQQEAFKGLQGVLRDPNATIDEVVSSLHHTIVHDPESRRLHLRGSDAIIVARGGLKKVFEQCQILQPDHIFLQYTFAPFDVDQYSELERLRGQFFTTLVAIQESSTHYTRIKSESKNLACTVNVADCKEQGDTILQQRQYVAQHERLFGPETTVGQLIRRDFDRNAGLVVKSRLFAALYYLGALLLEYNTLEERTAFFKQLEKSATALSTVCVDTVTGSQRLMPGTFIFMVAHVDRQIQEQSYHTNKSSQKGVDAAITGIAAVKLYGLFPDSMRERLHSHLQSWILGEGDVHLREPDIMALSVTIDELWFQQQRSRVPEQQSPSYFEEKHDVLLANQVAEAADTIQCIADEYLQHTDIEEDERFLDVNHQTSIISTALA